MTNRQKGFLIGVLGLIVLAQGVLQLEVSSISVPKSSASPTLGATLPVAGTTYSISGSGIAPSDTTITLQSFTIPQTGQPIQSTDLSPTFFLTLEPGNNTKQEIVACTSVTQNNTGTATLNNCARGMSPVFPYTASTTLQFAHAGGSRVILSDAPQLFNLYAAKANNELITGQWTASSTQPMAYDQTWGITSSSTNIQIPYSSWVFNNFLDIYDNQSVAGIKTFTSKNVFSVVPTISQAPSAPTDAANKNYVDNVALVSAPVADIVTKGVVQEATSTDINLGTAAGGTGANLFINPLFLANSIYGSTTASTTIQAVSTKASTTTRMYAGQVAVVLATVCSQDSNSLGLFGKQVGRATSTMSGFIQNTSGGNVAEGFNGTFTSVANGNVEFYMSNDSTGNGYFNPGCTGGTTWSILKFATSSLAN